MKQKIELRKSNYAYAHDALLEEYEKKKSPIKIDELKNIFLNHLVTFAQGIEISDVVKTLENWRLITIKNDEIIPLKWSQH